MYFCPKCGSVLVARGGMLICPKCGFSRPVTSRDTAMMRKTTVLQHVESRKVVEAVNLDLPPGAVYDSGITCPRCGHRGVFYWRKQRSSAESSDMIEKTYRCPSCNYSWSEAE